MGCIRIPRGEKLQKASTWVIGGMNLKAPNVEYN